MLNLWTPHLTNAFCLIYSISFKRHAFFSSFFFALFVFGQLSTFFMRAIHFHIRSIRSIRAWRNEQISFFIYHLYLLQHLTFVVVIVIVTGCCCWCSWLFRQNNLYFVSFHFIIALYFVFFYCVAQTNSLIERKSIAVIHLNTTISSTIKHKHQQQWPNKQQPKRKNYYPNSIYLQIGFIIYYSKYNYFSIVSTNNWVIILLQLSLSTFLMNRCGKFMNFTQDSVHNCVAESKYMCFEFYTPNFGFHSNGMHNQPNVTNIHSHHKSPFSFLHNHNHYA